MADSKREEFKNRLVQLCVMAVINGTERVVVDLPSLLNLYDTEISKAREEGRREYARELLDDYYQPDSDSIEIDVSEIQSELSKLTTK
jgi:hypothetical protein